MDLSIETLYSYKMSVNCFHKVFFFNPRADFPQFTSDICTPYNNTTYLNTDQKKEAIFKQNKTRTETSKPTLDTKSKLK